MQVFSRNYRINSLVLNSSGRLGLYAMLNILQDCAWEHAHQMGHGHGATAARNTFWVLARQKLEMSRWPKWGEELHIETWVRTPESSSVIRDFAIYDQKKVLIGEATTGWLLMDMTARRPTRLDPATIVDAGFVLDRQASIDPKKISMEGEFEELTRFEVRNSDIDLNQHVNNTKYSQWVLDAVPMGWHQRFKLLGYEVNFLAETHLNDVISIEKMKLSVDKDTPTRWSTFRGVRGSDQKVVFTARTLATDLDRPELKSKL